MAGRALLQSMADAHSDRTHFLSAPGAGLKWHLTKHHFLSFIIFAHIAAFSYFGYRFVLNQRCALSAQLPLATFSKQAPAVLCLSSMLSQAAAGLAGNSAVLCASQGCSGSVELHLEGSHLMTRAGELRWRGRPRQQRSRRGRASARMVCLCWLLCLLVPSRLLV